jgi:hypothetical protein
MEKKSVQRIFGPKRDEVTGEHRKEHSKGLYNLHFSPTTEMGRTCSIYGREKDMSTEFLAKNFKG